MLEQIQAYLTERGWQYVVKDADTVATGFTASLPDGLGHPFPLYILRVKDAYGDAFLRFTILPFVAQPEAGYPPEVYVGIVNINHDLPQLKFAMDSVGDLELLYDLPSDTCNRRQFDRALQLLADYATAYYPELQRATQKPADAIDQG
jgi:hypothetical protein